jgi:hypothetical protein
MTLRSHQKSFLSIEIRLAEIKIGEPVLPDHAPGGAPNNPMGARAITLERSDVAIHGSRRC